MAVAATGKADAAVVAGGDSGGCCWRRRRQRCWEASPRRDHRPGGIAGGRDAHPRAILLAAAGRQLASADNHKIQFMVSDHMYLTRCLTCYTQ